MTIQKDGLLSLIGTLNLYKNERSAALELDYVKGQTWHILLANPVGDEINSLVEKAVSGPFGIKVRRLVGNLDVLFQGRNDMSIVLLVDIFK